MKTVDNKWMSRQRHCHFMNQICNQYYHSISLTFQNIFKNDFIIHAILTLLNLFGTDLKFLISKSHQHTLHRPSQVRHSRTRFWFESVYRQAHHWLWAGSHQWLHRSIYRLARTGNGRYPGSCLVYSHPTPAPGYQVWPGMEEADMLHFFLKYFLFA